MHDLKMLKPLISIVLPTYNGIKYLYHSVESCLHQTYTEWELIIVDDASTDSTSEIIASFRAKDSRIHSIRHTVNKKLPGALNTGFGMARGQFLTWTSDDNLYAPNALEAMLNHLLVNPKVGLVYTDYSIIDEDGLFIREHPVKEPSSIVYGCIVGPCFLYRREVYEIVGDYDENMFYVEDYDYWLRTARHYRFSSLHSRLYLYREHANSLSAQKNAALQTKILQTKTNNVGHIPWVDPKTKAEAFLVMMKSASSQRAFGSALRYLFSAIWNQPSLLLRKFSRARRNGITHA